MEDLKLSISHLTSAIPLLSPAAQTAAREALSLLQRARSLSESGDLYSLSALTPSALAHLIRTRREAAGLSQRRLAERAGLSDRTVKNVEQGEQSASMDTLRRLSGVAELDDLGWRCVFSSLYGPEPEHMALMLLQKR